MNAMMREAGKDKLANAIHRFNKQLRKCGIYRIMYRWKPGEEHCDIK
jgi:hypothetical protein